MSIDVFFWEAMVDIIHQFDATRNTSPQWELPFGAAPWKRCAMPECDLPDFSEQPFFVSGMTPGIIKFLMLGVSIKQCKYMVDLKDFPILVHC